jgi:UDP-N-acetylmuramoyl-L-alanyl-D-glutamate--2,6-diaminopimelate ligase
VTYSGLHATVKPVFDAGQQMRNRLASNAQLTGDSRKVTPGDGFVAFAGERADGRKFIGTAIAAGAAAIAFDADDVVNDVPTDALSIHGLKASAGVFASGFYANPSAKMTVIAVTGTNGKTSCSQWIASGLAAQGHPAAVVGTLGAGVIDVEGGTSLSDFGLTTPDAVALQRMLSSFKDQAVQFVALEASSIGIVQYRLAGTHVSIAVFTNLTRDHLDFHGTMQAYEAAKAELFAWPSLRYAIVNLNDASSKTMLARLPHNASQVRTIGYGIDVDGVRVHHDLNVASTLIASELRFEDSGVGFQLVSTWGNAPIQLQLHGLFNVSNALAVLATWLAADVPFEQAIAKLQNLSPVPGRLQQITSTREGLPLVFVDYAHSPDALEKALLALRDLTYRRNGKLWCLFGAGGDRDPGKRPMMARVAQQHADNIVLTSDNPRTESPEAILQDITAGFSNLSGSQIAIEVDRQIAISYAIAQAKAGDVLLIAGKGHEAYQEVMGVKSPFSDYTIAADLLASKVLR